MKRFIISIIIIALCVLACSQNEGTIFDDTSKDVQDTTTSYLISKLENISYGYELQFEYDTQNRLQTVYQDATPLLRFTYLSNTDAYFSGLRKIEQFKPLNDDFCGFEGRYPDTFIVDSVTANHISFRRETKRNDGSTACLSHQYITYTFENDLIKQFTIKHSNPVDSESPSVFTFHHDAMGNLETIISSGPSVDSSTLLSVVEHDTAGTRPDVLPILGTNLLIFQQYFFPNTYMSRSLLKKVRLYDNSKEVTTAYRFDENGLVTNQLLYKDGIGIQYKKEYVPAHN